MYSRPRVQDPPNVYAGDDMAPTPYATNIEQYQSFESPSSSKLTASVHNQNEAFGHRDPRNTSTSSSYHATIRNRIVPIYEVDLRTQGANEERVSAQSPNPLLPTARSGDAHSSSEDEGPPTKKEVKKHNEGNLTHRQVQARGTPAERIESAAEELVDRDSEPTDARLRAYKNNIRQAYGVGEVTAPTCRATHPQNFDLLWRRNYH